MTTEREALERELRAHVAGMQCAIDNCGISPKEWDAAAKYAMDNIGEWKRLLSDYAQHLSRAAEPVYQQAMTGGIWSDVSKEQYDRLLSVYPQYVRIIYTHPPEPARDAKDMRAMVRRAMNAEWCDRIMADCLLMGTDYGEEMMEAALKAAMAQEPGE